ncbi:MAG: hypothetical protein K6G63_03425 [Eubacterium sp.]|nr:hypothetical protein [Eubacterium sp.]
MKKPDLSKLISKMKKGSDFTITRSQYIAWTGIDIPQSKSYTEKKSAIAKRATEMGYEVKVIPEQLAFRRKIGG